MAYDARAEIRRAAAATDTLADGDGTMHDSDHAKRQLDALMTFVKEHNSFRELNGVTGISGSSASRLRAPSVPNIAQLSIADPTASSPKLSPCDGPAHISPSVSPRQSVVSPPDTYGHSRNQSGDTGVLSVSSESPSIPRETSLLYSRASSLLREGMGTDGVLVLNAPRSNSRNSSRRSSCVSPWELNGKSEYPAIRRGSISLSSDSDWHERPCELLGSSTSERGQDSCTLTKGLLHELFMSFPQGRIFNSIHNPADATVTPLLVEGLAQSFPDAHSVLFLPFWDWDKTRWIAAAVTWTNHGNFTENDQHYLQAFSDAMVSQLAQIDRATTERTKYDLLSSVSHELRSPLHGMLANSELLQSSCLDPSQQEMLNMIKTCGNTLLDTMNHLLDFAKINNLTNSNNLPSTGSQIDDMASTFDLDVLVEDVTDSLYAGNRASCKVTENDGSTSSSDLTVIARVEQRDSWKVQSVSGAWRRIIMNVLGNAFKFTRSGLIEVSLTHIQMRRNGSKSSLAVIQVMDTGCGISQNYLENGIFTPFSQENILTEGVGLGLSIAHQLITHLGGQLDVKSEVGVGTRVEIRIPIQFVESTPTFGPNGYKGTWKKKRVCLVGMNPDICNRDNSKAESKRKLAIQDAVSSNLLRHRSCRLSFAYSLKHANGDIAVVEEPMLEDLAAAGPVETTCQSLIVLGRYGSSTPADLDFDGAVNVAYIPQPLLPRRIFEALEKVGVLVPNGTPDGSFLDSPSDSSRGSSLAEALGMANALESPPAVRESISEYPFRLAEPREKGLHVLIVDDNDINLKVLSTFMRKIGCPFETASNGEIAVEKYKAARPQFDYVLMDISMPVMNGIVASSIIRDYEEEACLRRSVIMAVTGVGSSEVQEEAFTAGIDEYLVKPLALRDLKRIMGIS